MKPRWMALTALAAVLAWAMSGSAALGLACFGYGVAACHAWDRRRGRVARVRARAESLELLACAAADLRAGAMPAARALPDRELDRLARAAQRISDRTGAPLADLLDRLERQQTALSRLDSAAHAQSTGVRTTVALLFGLPLIGLGLGHLVGADAVGVLLHTDLGQASAALALALQLAGLAWVDRLARSHDGLRRTARTRLPDAAVPGLGQRLRAQGLGRLISAPALASRSRALDAVVSAPRPRADARGGVRGRPDSWRAERDSAPNPLRSAPTGLWQRLCAVALRGIKASGQWRRAFARRPQTSIALAGELAAAADLIAASLRAGAPVGVAVLAAGETLAGPLSPTLTGIGRQLRLGAPPAEAWQPLSAIAPARRIVNAACRSAESGAALSGALTRCADDLRTDIEHSQQAQAQRVAVLLVLPLGLCFLPAFVLAGLVPVVLAVLREVW